MTIYFIQASSGAIKIGVTSRDPKRRLSALQTGHAETLCVIALMDGDAATETSLHKQFAEDRIRGEWFRPSAALLDFVRPYRLSNEPEKEKSDWSFRRPEGRRQKKVVPKEDRPFTYEGEIVIGDDGIPRVAVWPSLVTVWRMERASRLNHSGKPERVYVMPADV